MVYAKVKKIILVFLIFILSFAALRLNGNIETNMLKTLLPKSVSEDIITLADKSASSIKVVFESNDDEILQKLRNDFVAKIDSSYFEIIQPNLSELIQIYLQTPENFLSDDMKEQLYEKKYDEIYSKSLQALYNPASIQLTTFDKDPFFISNDFIMSKIIDDKTGVINNKLYDFLILKIRANEGLSPNLSNKKVSEIVNLQNSLTQKDCKIYLAGNPIHSYYTSQKSIVGINIICALSTILIIFLTYFYFRDIKCLVLASTSIIIGMLAGYIATRLLFSDFQIITMVFSTTLIGIGIDYSYHYFFASKIDKTFYKNITYSLITTIIPFIILYFTGIELLKQISVFTVVGLVAIALIVVIFYKDFNLPKAVNTITTNKKFAKIILALLLVFSIVGYFKFQFNDTLTSFYTPSKKLMEAEALFNNVSGNNVDKKQIITIKGDNIDDIIKKEEKITSQLAKNNLKYLSLSSFIPSIDVQKQNYSLVKNLYSEKLDKYADILTDNQILKLKNLPFHPIKFQISKYPFLLDFMLNDKTSIIIVNSSESLSYISEDINVVNIQKDISKYLSNYRKKLMRSFPYALLILSLIVAILYGIKNSIKIILPPLMGIVSACGMACLIFGEINLFGIIALYMVIGFTMDYSIFRISGEKCTENAIMVSSLTTSFSFLLLSIIGFKLLSTISLILFFGIIVSYFTGFVIFKNKS